MNETLFPLGPCVITQAAEAKLSELKVAPQFLLGRHAFGNFGTAGNYAEIKPTITPTEWEEGVMATSDDGKINVISIDRNQGRVCSYYNLGGHTVWVMTELGPEGYTTVLLPSDY